MEQDIFCKIIDGQIPGEFIYKDELIAVIKDIHPQAPVHLLVMPVNHFDSIADTDESLLGRLLATAHRVAGEQGLSGYRLIINDGEDGGKLVPHLHIHVLGGKRLGPKIVND